MATSKSEPVKTSDLSGTTTYVTETAPKLPSLDTAVSTPDPVIDQRLIDARNAEAKAAADRLK